jgi:hypothetical protein
VVNNTLHTITHHGHLINMQYIYFPIDVAIFVSCSLSIFYLFFLLSGLPTMGCRSSYTRPPSQNSQTHMGETQPSSNIESFSNNWLMNNKKPVKFVDSPNDSLRFSLDLEADHPKASTKCTERSSFHFDHSGSLPTDISVADQMICNGSLVPLNLINQQNNVNESNVIPEESVSIKPHLSDTPKMLRPRQRHVAPNCPITPNSSSIHSNATILQASNYSNADFRAAKCKLHSFEGQKKPSKKIAIWKHLKSLVHFCKKVKEFGVDEVRRVSPRSSDDATFRTMSSCSSPLYDVAREHAIREAILHCKSSSRKYMVILQMHLLNSHNP